MEYFLIAVLFVGLFFLVRAALRAIFKRKEDRNEDDSL